MSVTLLQGDCLEVMRGLAPGSVDMVLCDPPYSTPTVAAFGRKTIKRLSDLAIQEWYFRAIKAELERVLAPDGCAVIFCDDAYYPVLFSLFYEWHQTNLLIWDKARIGMGNPFRRQHELIFYAGRDTRSVNKAGASHIPTILREPLSKEHHGAEKPVALLTRLLGGLARPGATILDPFMGSGSTGVAAASLGLGFVGIELDPGYFAIAERRIAEARAPERMAA